MNSEYQTPTPHPDPHEVGEACADADNTKIHMAKSEVSYYRL